MNFAGKTCGMCNKGKLTPIKDDVSTGVYVDAYKCKSCGEIAYSREVMLKVEAMHKATSEERKLVKVGSSIAAVIPADIVAKLKLKPKEKVYITTKNNEIIITPSLM